MLIHHRLAALPLAVFCAYAGAADIYVSPAGDDTNPGTEALPFATIDAAVAAASAGDTIFLKPGTYEGPEHRGHNITFDLSFVGDGPAGSVICSGADFVPSDPFDEGDERFASSTGASLTVDNVIFESFLVQQFDSVTPAGAVFDVDGGSLTVRDSSFFRNATVLSDTENGGAIAADAATLLIENCAFERNFSSWVFSQSIARGPAIYSVGGDVTITDSTFFDHSGAGIVTTISAPEVTVERSVFERNGRDGPGDFGNNGPALSILAADRATVSDTVFDRNSTLRGNTGSFEVGATAGLEIGAREVVVERSIFFRNSGRGDSDNCSVARTGAIAVDGGDQNAEPPIPVLITDCLFVGNRVGDVCESVLPGFEPDARSANTVRSGAWRTEFVNCTFALSGGAPFNGSNEVFAAGNAFAPPASDTLSFENCVFYEPGNLFVLDDSASAEFASSITAFGTAEPGLSAADPLFVDLPTTIAGLDGLTLEDIDARLLPASPAIDAGNNSAASSLDLDGNNRITDGDGDGTAAVDLGAYEFTPPCMPDFSGDGNLNTTDINLFVTAFLSMDPAADITGDGLLNIVDVNLFAQLFIAGCD